MLQEDEFNPWRRFLGLFVPYVVAECRELTPGAKLCYGRLMAFAGQNGLAWPTVSQVADALGVTQRHARRYLSELRDRGFIRVYDRRFEGKPSVYAFLRHPMLSDRSPPSTFTEGDETLYEHDDDGEFESAEDNSLGTSDIKVRRGDHRTDMSYPHDADVLPPPDTYVRSSFNRFREEIQERDSARASASAIPSRSSGSPLSVPARTPSPKAFEEPVSNQKERNGGGSNQRERKAATRALKGFEAEDRYSDTFEEETSRRDPATGRESGSAPGPAARLRSLSDIELAAKERATAARQANFAKAQRRKQATANLNSDGLSSAPPNVRASLKEAEDAWRSEFSRRYPKLTNPAWTAAERGQVRELLTKYDGKTVVTAVRYVIREWDRISTRYLKGQGGFPGLGILVKLHRTLFAEAETWAEHANTLDEWRIWFEKNPDNPYPPAELEERYTLAKKELAAIGLK